MNVKGVQNVLNYKQGGCNEHGERYFLGKKLVLNSNI